MDNKLVLIAAIVLISAFAGVLYFLRVHQSQSLSKNEMDYANMHQSKIEEEPRLRTTRSTKEVREHLLDRAFGLSKETQDIGGACKSAFWSSFSFPSGQEASDGIPMANPGEVFQYGDAWQAGAPPLRRLIFGGELASGCFIYYQRGGLPYPRSCLAVMDYKEGRAVWVGQAGINAHDLPELRRMLSGNAFEDGATPRC